MFWKKEVAFKIMNDECKSAPSYLIDGIKTMNFNCMEEFTAYPEGAPTHPSWPGMFSACSNSF